MTQELKPWEAAIENFDWGQPRGRDWNPCFRIMEDGTCCGRAKWWDGHDRGHQHLSLLQFIRECRTPDAASEKVRREVAEELSKIARMYGELFPFDPQTGGFDAVLRHHPARSAAVCTMMNKVLNGVWRAKLLEGLGEET